MSVFHALRTVFLAVILFPLVGCSSGELTAEKKEILDQDPRNQVVDFTLSVSGDSLSYCINNITGAASSSDVFRVFLQAADRLKDRTFKEVFLCFRSDNKFVLGGADFAVLGAEYGTQNPMYTIRTFPEKILLLTGENAFSTHKGGLLYLMRAQMNDFQEMHKAWYLDELVAELTAEKDAKRPAEFAPDEEVF